VAPAPTSNNVPAPAAAVGYTLRTLGPRLTLNSNWFVLDGMHIRQNSDGSVTDMGGGVGEPAVAARADLLGRRSNDLAGRPTTRAVVTAPKLPAQSGGVRSQKVKPRQCLRGRRGFETTDWLALGMRLA
jgi:hypothetical protein